MFGSFRTYLALMVVAYHLLGIPLIGPYAVFSFFVLSGFLMTTIMHEAYGYTAPGRQRFITNRFLRLYPAYWISAFVGLVVILYCGEIYTTHFRGTIYLPRTTSAIFSNLTMIFPNFFPNRVEPRLSPPTWAITIELVYYALICIGISRTRILSVAWLVASLLYVVVTVVLREPHAWRYASLAAGSLPFSIGACVYFYKDKIRKALDASRLLTLRNIAGAHVATSALTVVLFHFTKSDALQEAGLYLSTALTTALLVRLYYLQAPAGLKALDKRIGDYSYPIYLLHWQLGALAAFWLRRVAGHGYGTAAVFALTLAMVLTVATAIVFGADPFVERLRTSIRRPASPKGALDPASVTP